MRDDKKPPTTIGFALPVARVSHIFTIQSLAVKMTSQIKKTIPNNVSHKQVFHNHIGLTYKSHLCFSN